MHIFWHSKSVHMAMSVVGASPSDGVGCNREFGGSGRGCQGHALVVTSSHRPNLNALS